MSTLPTTAEKRELALAELRVERIRQQLVVAHIDCLATGIKSGLIPPDAVARLLAEAFGVAEDPERGGLDVQEQ